MAAENSFDIVSKVDLQEVSNAIQNALKEIHTRFDLKDSKSDIQLEGKEALVLSSADEYKLKAVTDILQSKLVKRGVPIKALDYGVVEPAAGSSVRQKITMQQGIPIEKAREIVKLIKDSKKKVQASIQGDTVRVSGKDRDALQEMIALLRGHDFGIDMQFTNYRKLEKDTLSSPATTTAKEVFELLRDDLAAIEREFGRDTVSSVRAITDIGEHLRAGGGKRIRPVLLLLAAKLFPHEETSAIKLGAVVEMLHTATLVHDDIIDEAKTRRGRPAANTKWGNSKCVLAGDWLYMQAFKIAVQERNFRVLDVLIDLTQQMVEGELLQMEKLGKIISLDEHFDLIFRKTACLFSVSTRLGALIGNATEEQEERPGRIRTQPRPGVSDRG